MNLVDKIRQFKMIYSWVRDYIQKNTIALMFILYTYTVLSVIITAYILFRLDKDKDYINVIYEEIKRPNYVTFTYSYHYSLPGIESAYIILREVMPEEGRQKPWQILTGGFGDFEPHLNKVDDEYKKNLLLRSYENLRKVEKKSFHFFSLRDARANLVYDMKCFTRNNAIFQGDMPAIVRVNEYELTIGNTGEKTVSVKEYLRDEGYTSRTLNRESLIRQTIFLEIPRLSKNRDAGMVSEILDKKVERCSFNFSVYVYDDQIASNVEMNPFFTWIKSCLRSLIFWSQ